MRSDLNLKQRYRAILSYTGLILCIVGILMLTPLLALLVWPGEWPNAIGFIIPAISLSCIGIVIRHFLRPRGSVILTVQEGGVVVLLSWVATCLFSALPFIFTQGLNFTQATFESVSGWTTTGLSVVNVTRASHVILLWRSVMQLAGGAGLAIIMLAAIAGPTGSGLSVAEGRGEQLVPHVRESARIVATIYAGYALIGTVSYWFAGMDIFDAVNHAFAAISTGGFSTQVTSIGHWDSIAVEAVTVPLMILGNLNFLMVYLLLHGKFRTVYRNGEMRLLGILIPICTLLVFLLVCRGLFSTLGKGIRVAIFEVTSAITTTGFSTVSYSNWNPTGFLALIVLMLIGGGTCSTAGGIKQYRVYLLFKALIWGIRRPLLPRTAIVENYIWQGERKDFINSERIQQVAIFVFFYFIVYILGLAVLTTHGYDLRDSLFEFASALSTVGLSIGVTAPSSPPLVLWMETLAMFLGRLEFFVVFISLGKIIRDSYAALR